MKAIVYSEYGPPDVLRLKEVDKPEPKEDELLIKVRATSVGYGDLLTRNLKNATSREFNMPMFMLPMVRLVFGYWTPRKTILGSEVSGVVESTGKDVADFVAGDEVLAYPEMNFGGYAEYIRMSSKGMVVKKPVNMSFAQAAATPMGAITALGILRKVDMAGQRAEGADILVNGASGSIGGFATQIAKAFGAKVTGVCGSSRQDHVRALGADEVIDYTNEDFTQRGVKYNVILDVLGKSSFSKCRDSLKPNGIYLLASFRTKHLIQMLWTKIRGGKKVVCAPVTGSLEDLHTIRGMVEQGKLKVIIDKAFPLEQAVEAHRYAESDERRGTVVIAIGQQE